MAMSYKKLWKLLIDKDMYKKDLMSVANISNFTMSKMSRGEPISGEIMMRICKALSCNIGDIVDVVADEPKTEGSEEK